MSETITRELKAIREDLDFIKKHMIDTDSILTIKEEEKLNNSLKEYDEGKTIELKDL